MSDLEATNKRIDRLGEYTSQHADLLIKIINKLEEVELRQQELSQAVILIHDGLQDQLKYGFLLIEKMNTLRHQGFNKERNRWLQREMDNLKSQVDYLNDRVFEKTSDPLKRSEKL